MSRRGAEPGRERECSDVDHRTVEGWVAGFAATTAYAMAGLVLLFVARWLTEWLLLSGVTFREEVVEQTVPNVGVGYPEAIFYVGASPLIGWSAPTAPSDSNGPARLRRRSRRSNRGESLREAGSNWRGSTTRAQSGDSARGLISAVSGPPVPRPRRPPA
jgi:hypothetical protein